jgi:hypothetical protein
MSIKYNERTLNGPSVHKLHIPTSSIARPSQIYSILDFLFWKQTIWQSWPKQWNVNACELEVGRAQDLLPNRDCLFHLK